MNQPTEESFLRDVAKHEMTVIHDAGEIRHLSFKQPGTWNHHFNLTTVPGYLMFTGDMGAWTFTRLRDMFQFFRDDRSQQGPLRINRGYWSEKLQAADCGGCQDGGAMEYSRDMFNAEIYRRALDLARSAKEDGATIEQRAGLIEALRDVRNQGETEWDAHRAAYEFEYRINGRVYQLSDFWETSLRVYRYRFTWACYAIAWAIRVYDASKVIAPADAEVAA